MKLWDVVDAIVNKHDVYFPNTEAITDDITNEVYSTIWHENTTAAEVFDEATDEMPKTPFQLQKLIMAVAEALEDMGRRKLAEFIVDTLLLVMDMLLEEFDPDQKYADRGKEAIIIYSFKNIGA